MFCRHKWREVRRTSTPPSDGFKFGGGIMGVAARRLIFGWTTIELVCTKCEIPATRVVEYSPINDTREAA